VCALYDRLWDVAPPLETADQRRSAAKSRNRAARYGWAVPLAWDDDTIDCPDAKPDHGHGRPGAAAERARLVAELTAAGLSATAIARRLEMSERSVHRLRGRAS
jgi:DNA-binding NarL/FixJ family response regulator